MSLALPSGEAPEAAPQAFLPSLKGQSGVSLTVPGQRLLVFDLAGVFCAGADCFSLPAVGKASPAFSTFPIFTCHHFAVTYL